jgi:hypothetical protein
VSTYAEFKSRYASLGTEELLRIAATSDLVPEAALAMKSELDSRRLEIEREKYEVFVGPTAPPPMKHFNLWFHVTLALVSGAVAFLAWAWDAITLWVRQ